MMETTCNKNYKTCKHLNTRVDAKWYPYGYECMKYYDSVFRNKFEDTKEFEVRKEVNTVYEISKR